MTFVEQLINISNFPSEPLNCGVIHWKNFFQKDDVYTFEKFKEFFYSSDADHVTVSKDGVQAYTPFARTTEKNLIEKDLTLQTYFKKENMFSEELLAFRTKCREIYNIRSNFVFVSSTQSNSSAYGYHTDVFGSVLWI